MTTDGSPPDGVEVLGPDPDLVAGSAILEKAAHQAAVPVQRLSETLVLCDTASGGVIFYGLTGQTCGRSAEVLCSNDAWLREYLADRGLPVVASRLLDVAAGETVESTAAALGFPLQLRPALASQPKFEVDGPDALSQAWRSVVEMLPPRAQILLERASQGSELSLAVVAGRVVASAPDLQPSPEVANLAVRAVELLPGAQCASVEFRISETGVQICRVDPLLRQWSRHPGAAVKIAAAILARELN